MENILVKKIFSTQFFDQNLKNIEVVLILANIKIKKETK